jgi:hypothetical protein
MCSQEKFDRIAKEIEDICRRNLTELDPDNVHSLC